MSMFDISPTISAQTAVFPGDQKFENNYSMSQSRGDHLDLSSMTTTLHIGSHADAPSHYGLAETIEQVALIRYMGLAQVITVDIDKGARIQPDDMSLDIKAPRVLFKTNSFPDPDSWNDDFNSLSPDLINKLSVDGVKLVGIDTPSIDPADSKFLESHKAVLKNRMSILEGLVLVDVPDGLYQLIALPLKIKGAEASPVRAILMDLDSDIKNH